MKVYTEAIRNISSALRRDWRSQDLRDFYVEKMRIEYSVQDADYSKAFLQPSHPSGNKALEFLENPKYVAGNLDKIPDGEDDYSLESFV